MEIVEHTRSLLATLRKFLDLEEGSSLELNEDHECIVTIEGKFVVMFYLEEEVNTLLIHIPLAVLPEDESREEVLFELLCGNYAWNLTNGGTLGVDKETAVITLGYPVPLPLAPPDLFADIVAKLIHAADYWMKTLEHIAEDYGPALPGPPPGDRFIKA